LKSTECSVDFKKYSKRSQDTLINKMNESYIFRTNWISPK